MTDLRPAVREFLGNVCPDAGVEPMVGDASTRRFYRISPPGAPTRVLMDYGGPFEETTDDVELTRIFLDAGLPVARILETCGPVGCLLLEDLGNRSLESALGEAAEPDRRRLLEQAVRLAARLADDGTPALARSSRAEGPALDAERFRFEMEFFVEHYVVGLHGIRLPQGLTGPLHRLADEAAEGPRVLCHRDYHSRNLMLDARDAPSMVDIQDARWGPDTYDLASLLRDAYVDVDESWIDPLIDLYLASLDAPPAAAAFRARFARVAIQRMIKALGTFGFQIGRLGRERYLDSIPRTLARLRRLLPELPDVQGLLEALSGSGLLEPPPRR